MFDTVYNRIDFGHEIPLYCLFVTLIFNSYLVPCNNYIMTLFLIVLIILELNGVFSSPMYNKVIPKLIFRVHEVTYSELHPTFKDILNRTVRNNPEYCIVYFDKRDRFDFINRFYPEYLEAYNDTIPGAYKADIFRQLVVYRYGGIYNDLSIDYLVPIGEIVRDSDQFVGVVAYNSRNLVNGFFACYERCPSIGHMIVTMMHKVYYQQYGNNHHLDITGPIQFGSAFRNFYYNQRAKFTDLFGEYVIGTHNITGDSSSFQFFKYATKSLIRNKVKAVFAVICNSSYNVLVMPTSTKEFKGSEHCDHVFMTNKFKNSDQLLYQHGQGKYTGYYYTHTVYQNGAHTLSVNSVKEILKSGTRLKGLEGNLIGSRHNQSTVWYVMNGTRRCFPDMKTFRKLGFDIDSTLPKVPLEIINAIPIGECFTTNLNISMQEVKSHFFLPNYLESLKRVNQAKLQLFLDSNKGKVIEYKDFISSVE